MLSQSPIHHAKGSPICVLESTVCCPIECASSLPIVAELQDVCLCYPVVQQIVRECPPDDIERNRRTQAEFLVEKPCNCSLSSKLKNSVADWRNTIGVFCRIVP